MDIVRPLVTSEDYVVQKYTKAHPFKAMGRVQASASAAETPQSFGSTTELLNLFRELELYTRMVHTYVLYYLAVIR